MQLTEQIHDMVVNELLPDHVLQDFDDICDKMIGKDKGLHETEDGTAVLFTFLCRLGIKDIAFVRVVSGELQEDPTTSEEEVVFLQVLGPAMHTLYEAKLNFTEKVPPFLIEQEKGKKQNG